VASFEKAGFFSSMNELRNPTKNSFFGRISKCRSKDLESVARLLASDARCGLLANFLQNATK
jgi:hypothetical protein